MGFFNLKSNLGKKTTCPKNLLTCPEHNCILKKAEELKRRTCTGSHYEEKRRLLGERDHHITPELERLREGRTSLAAYTLDQGYQRDYEIAATFFSLREVI